MDNDCLRFVHALVIACCLVMPVCTYGAAEEQSDDAVQVIDTWNNALLISLKNGEKLGYSGRYDLLKPSMSRIFHFSYMLEKSCGSFWEEMESEQRRQLLERYIAWSVGTYARRFDKYEGQRFMIHASERLGGMFMEVSTTIDKAGKEQDIRYLLIQDEGAWRIVDIKVKGVSQLALTRSQFRSILKKEGAAGLLKRLDEKITDLEDEPNMRE